MTFRFTFVVLLPLLPALWAAEPIDFNTQIRPILNRNCTACHGGVKQAGGLSFIYRDIALGEGESGERAIVPGKPEASELVRRIMADDPDDQMPPPEEHPEGLEPEERALLKQWIAEGAEWGEHWSFEAPVDPPLPEVRDDSWPVVPLDRFILARLEAEKLAPSPPADGTEWLRRASFDLTGLPPADADVQAFEADLQARPDEAPARAVDRLLASPAFGERWAAMWLDLARYADTMGFEKDPHRDVWPYRDWVIRAFNDDLPLDRFVVKQLAGDLLPEPGPDEFIATAFHRNTMTNTEGGTDDEEFRVAAVIDRINTTFTVLQGMTFGCVQCHAHPYDPFEAESYYKVMAFFNNTEDCDLDDEYPTLKVHPDPQVTAHTIALERKATELRDQANARGRAHAGTAEYTPLAFASTTSTAGQLTVGSDGFLRVSGTVPTSVTYTLTAPAVPFTALRIDLRPEGDDPNQWPERGSVLSKIETALRYPDGREEALPLWEVFADHLGGPFDPDGSIRDGAAGFGGYPKLFGPRWAVIVPDNSLSPPEGTTLIIKLHQNASTTGNQAVPLRRFQISTSNTDGFHELVHSPEQNALWAEYRKTLGELGQAPGQQLPVMRARPQEATRETRQFIRGNSLEKGDLFQPGVPKILPPLEAGNPNRLDLAEWFVADENPLTARALANRFWAALFGIGLVETMEDFGSTGTPPSHPHLLDHLACRLRDTHQWHLKPFLRELVLSRTYRQSHQASPELRERDPRNRLLARGPATRLSSEMVRDHALAASGLLVRTQGGPPVMPPQPDGIWQSVYNGAQWKTADGPDRYRRAVYTYWKRTSPYPSFLTFDAPSREVCTPRRIPTNTPLQALVTLNDPVYLECARALAKRMIEEGGPTLPEQIAWAVRHVTHQDAAPETIATLRELHEDAAGEYASHPELAAKLAATPEDAARVLVANTIFNLDAALTK